MPTLQELRQHKYKTIKAFAQAYGCSPSKASGMLKGLYHRTLSKGDVALLAETLGISFDECVNACDATYAEYRGYKGDAWKGSKSHESLWTRWQWEEDLENEARKASESGDWSEFRRKHTSWSPGSDGSTWSSQGHTATWTLHEDCFTVLGVTSTASPMQIKQAFRDKVKAMADGKGGYNGDMDKLVTAKEQALAHAEKAGVR